MIFSAVWGGGEEPMWHKLATSSAAVAVLLVAVGTPTPVDMVSTAGYRFAAVRGEVICDAAVENPHFSRGFGGIIFKTRITCRGDAPPVQFRLQGSLGSVAGGGPGRPAQGPPVPRATSDQVQTIPMGATVTYYTPQRGDTTTVRGSGTYVGSVTGELVGPPGIVSDGPSRASSNYAYVVDPG